MPISKQDYIYRSLKKVSHKGWETFVISRIIHGLDDDDIEFVTQQLVRLSDGSRALTDLYFPQFDLHVEVDEGYHDAEEQKKLDMKRELDIIRRTNHNVRRIKIGNGKDKISDTIRHKSLTDIRHQIDNLVEDIRNLKQQKIRDGDFSAWNLEKRYLAEATIRKGYLDVKDNVVFQVQLEALKCFGFEGEGYQRGAWTIRWDGSNDVVWFPRLYEHGMWKNELTNDGKTIIERAINENEEGIASIAKQRRDEEQYNGRKYIVFAKARDPLGFNLLRYVGTFKMNLERSSAAEIIFDLVSTKEDVRRRLN